MSYILTGNSNPVFNLQALILAPMLQSAIVCKLTADRKVDLVLRYQGLCIESSLAEPAENDPAWDALSNGMNGEIYPGVRQQVAVFSIIESYNTQVDPDMCGGSFTIPLTAMTLEHALFAFIPKIISTALDTEKLVQGGE